MFICELFRYHISTTTAKFTPCKGRCTEHLCDYNHKKISLFGTIFENHNQKIRNCEIITTAHKAVFLTHKIGNFIMNSTKTNTEATVEIEDNFTENEEIIKLAKENSPRLLNVCKTAHPIFFERLKNINHNLKKSELIFCIYLKLDFTTKEIATFIFVTPKAIQNRKNRLRKKLNISSDVDIYKWFADL